MSGANNGISSVQLLPKSVATPQGVVEYVEFGEGPPIIALHGAMGGCDQIGRAHV